ncbi:restriction endonuclease subunit S [Leptospira jelokensis]|uniref:Restriction endonuclease subunit S n=1 Tax=Leptospira jelokensis TaxID=2484931 RepID=A0A4Z0ZYI4_9LEPT|nr:restriction endonuclease subunit S [Leptospira jelokensis]TGL76891.1 restriction endonuclease subunit S [Leptospira jelokensis]
MINKWVDDLLENCVSIIDYRGKTPNKKSYGIPLITAKIVKDGRLDEPTEFIDPTEYDDWMRRGIPEPGDVILTSEAPLGEVAEIPNGKFALAQRVFTIRPNPNKMTKRFLKYFFITENFQNQLISRSSGTTVTGIKQSELRKLIVTYPPLPTQKAIAHILGTLDDKIELLRQMNETLEAMARALFKSWFVDFDPVRKKAEGLPTSLPKEIEDLFPSEFEDSELGEIPKGWKVGKLGDVGQIICGKTPPKSEKENYSGNRLFIKIPDMHGKVFITETTDRLSEKGYSSQSNKTLPRNSICVSCIATVGLVSITSEPSQTNQQINSIIPIEDDLKFFIYFYMKTCKEMLIALASAGSATLNLNTGEFGKIKILLPNKKITANFDSLINETFEKILSNKKEISNLSLIRDSLLPKLISGELELSDQAITKILEPAK